MCLLLCLDEFRVTPAFALRNPRVLKLVTRPPKAGSHTISKKLDFRQTRLAKLKSSKMDDVTTSTVQHDIILDSAWIKAVSYTSLAHPIHLP